MDKVVVLKFVFVASEIIAVFLIWSIWRGGDSLAMKLMMSVVAAIPVLGVLGVYWAREMPDPRHRALQNKGGSTIPTLEVFDRWRHVLEEPNKAKQKAKAAKLFEDGDN